MLIKDAKILQIKNIYNKIQNKENISLLHNKETFKLIQIKKVFHRKKDISKVYNCLITHYLKVKLEIFIAKVQILLLNSNTILIEHLTINDFNSNQYSQHINILFQQFQRFQHFQLFIFLKHFHLHFDK
jgi:hypothetical protein